MPNSFSGYMMIGNDANQQDSGTEYYIKKVPFSYSLISPYPITPPYIYPEATSLTLTGYEEFAVESTWNITVGTSTVNTAKIKIEPSAGTCIGNPDLDYPLALCWNATTSNASIWDTIAPQQYKGLVDIPQVLKGKGYVVCYRLNIPTALCDDKSGKYPQNALVELTLVPSSNPGVADSVNFTVLDYTYKLNDQNIWETGFGDDSTVGTDYDPGFDTTATLLTLWFA